MDRFVVVGGGLAGHNGALHLRKLAPNATITLLGEECGTPYDRPPLSKAFLLGTTGRDELTLRNATGYAEFGIEYRSSTRIEAVDRHDRRVLAADGTTYDYDRLLLATGSRPKKLPLTCAEVPLHYLRTLADAASLREELRPGRRVAIIGGGFIGLEVASSAAMLGCRVTVFEASSALLSRGMPQLLGRYVHRLHQSNGVEIMLNTTVTDAAVGKSGCRLFFSNSSVECDCVVVGIGVVPNVELAVGAGLEVEDGIVVDPCCRTSDPAIYAAGEVTAHPPGGRGAAVRLESWQVAAKQSLVAAACITGSRQVFDDPPWLWSDQFDVNIQSIGAPGAASRYLFRDVPERRGWTLLAMSADDLPAGAIAVNNGRDISMLRQPLRLGHPLPSALEKSFGPVPDHLWQRGVR